MVRFFILSCLYLKIIVFNTLNESLSQEILKVPQSLGIPDQPQPLFLEEIADTAQILLKSLIVEITPHVKLPQVSDIPEHLHKLHILDELLIQLIGLLGIVWRGLGFLALNAVTLLLAPPPVPTNILF